MRHVEVGTAGLSSKGFTLIELLVVIATIGVLISLLMPGVHGPTQHSWHQGQSNEPENGDPIDRNP